MVMFPVHPESVEPFLPVLNEAEAEGILDLGTGCDWHSLPLLMGANVHSLFDTDANSRPKAYVAAFGDRSITLCRDGLASQDCTGGDDYLPPTYFRITGTHEPDGDLVMFKDDSHYCVPSSEVPSPTATPGQMIMNLIVKIRSTSFATGMLVFEGEKDGYTFKAKAPVTLSR